jgi:hypothetical protein
MIGSPGARLAEPIRRARRAAGHARQRQRAACLSRVTPARLIHLSSTPAALMIVPTLTSGAARHSLSIVTTRSLHSTHVRAQQLSDRKRTVCCGRYPLHALHSAMAVFTASSTGREPDRSIRPADRRVEDAPAGSVFDGELVAIAQRDGRPVEDFAMVSRAVLRGDIVAAEHLRFIGFDLLALVGEDLLGRPWRERDQRLAEALPVCRVVRRVKSRPATAGCMPRSWASGSRVRCSSVRARCIGPGVTASGASTRLGTRRTACCWRSVRTETGTGTACAMSMAGGWWRSPAPAPLTRSASLSAWSTRASTATVSCARSSRCAGWHSSSRMSTRRISQGPAD